MTLNTSHRRPSKDEHSCLENTEGQGHSDDPKKVLLLRYQSARKGDGKGVHGKGYRQGDRCHRREALVDGHHSRISGVAIDVRNWSHGHAIEGGRW